MEHRSPIWNTLGRQDDKAEFRLGNPATVTHLILFFFEQGVEMVVR